MFKFLSSLFTFPMMIAVLTACGGAKTTNLTPSPSKEVIDTAPDWFKSPPTESDQIFAATSALSADLQISIEKAKTVAQANLSQQLEVHVENLTENFLGEMGEQANVSQDYSVTKQFKLAAQAVTANVLVGARIAKQEIVPQEDLYRAYVLMTLPLGKVNKKLLEKIKADKRLYIEMQASEHFKKMERKIDQKFSK